MEDIQIYRSTKRTLGLMLLGFGMAGASCFLFQYGETGEIIAWCGLVFFGLASLLLPIMLFIDRKKNRPFITIKSDRVIVRSMFKANEMLFDDVEGFYLYMEGNLVGVRYNEEAEKRRMKESTFFPYLMRELNGKISGVKESISTGGLTMTGSEIFEIIKTRFEKYHHFIKKSK